MLSREPGHTKTRRLGVKRGETEGCEEETEKVRRRARAHEGEKRVDRYQKQMWRRNRMDVRYGCI